MSTQSLTQRWLRQNIQSYHFNDIVYTHVDAVLAKWSSIRPKTDIYTYNDGRTQLLLCLHGLLPIFYRGTPYNIPIAIWVTKEYPRLPPIAYVVPTHDMLIRSGKYMDVSGRCEIEYLKNWERKPEGCDISALLEAMQDHFSREPPVYARPKQPQSPRPQAQTPRAGPDTLSPSYSERPPPPLPSETRPSQPTQQTPVTIVRNDDRPPVPLKPGIPPPISSLSAPPSIHPQPTAQAQLPSGVGQAGMSTSFTPAISSQSFHQPTLAARPPPLPPPPPSHTGPTDSGTILPAPTRYHQGSSSPSPSVDNVNLPGRTTWSPGTPGVQTVPHVSHSIPYVGPTNRISAPTSHVSPVTQMMTSPVPSTSSGPGAPSYQYSPPPPPPLPVSPLRSFQPQPQYPPPPPFVSPESTGISASHYQPATHPPPFVAQAPATIPLPPNPPVVPIPDLLDDDDLASLPTSAPLSAPVPPRPPNPELLRLHSQVYGKLTGEIASLTQAMALDAERYRAQQSDLLKGEPAIRDEMARLEAVKDVCTTVAARLRSVVEEAESNVAELKRKGDPEVDELVCSTSIVHNQLINLVAEDNAIEDTIYHLHRALNSGRIDLERFLRTTRVLAEEQFMKRALIGKILGGLPMGGSSMPMAVASDWR